jgi:PKD repeat protein
LPTRTPATTSGAPTTLPLTTNPTRANPQIPPTAVVIRPATVVAIPPTNTFVPVNIVILSPVPGNVVAGAVQVFGSATHPNFLQYQVEFGPDPNGSNLWYPASAAVTTPVVNGILGIWNTQSIPDGVYQLRLRVFLRDGTLLTTVVNNIRVQNRINTPVPSNTPQIDRPIAAFNVNTSSGQVPLAVNFTNQSSGQINSLQWNFGDNTTSTDANPVHTYANPGLYTVTLTVSGPGGTANVSRQISAQSPNAPVAGFTLDRTAGVAPVTIQFTDQSTGNITGYQWNFLDGTTSTERSPRHEFTIPGTYNVLLTVTGPGGSSTAVRQITVTSPNPPTSTWTPTWTTIPPTATWTPTWTWTPTSTDNPPTATWTPTSTNTPVLAAFAYTPVQGNPLAVQFFDQSTGPVASWSWNFGDPNNPNAVSDQQNPAYTYLTGGTYLVTLTVTSAAGLTSTAQQQVTVSTPPTATWTWTPTATQIPLDAAFTFAPVEGDPLAIQFTNLSTGNITFLQWDFGDQTNSNETNPQHRYAPEGGTFLVTLTVVDANGGQDTTSQQVMITPAPTATWTWTPTATQTPLDAVFTFAPVEGNPLAIQFIDQSTGPVTSWLWSFGDPNASISPEQNPEFTFPAAGGTFLVTLTVFDQTGASDSAQQQVMITPAPTAEPTVAPTTEPTVEPTVGTPSIVMTTPVLPNINELVQVGLANLYNPANSASVFSTAGDNLFESPFDTGLELLRPFALGTYDIGDHPELQSVIDFYNNGMLTDGTPMTSFDHESQATGSGWRTYDLTDQGNVNQTLCPGGASPLVCELQAVRPGVMLISVGMTDALDNRDRAAFRDSLQAIVNDVMANGTIPVLMTTLPRTDGSISEAQLLEFNELIVQVATDNRIPLINVYRGLWELNAEHGLNGGTTLSTAPSGGGSLWNIDVSGYGVNALNLWILQTLDAIKTTVFGQ